MSVLLFTAQSLDEFMDMMLICQITKRCVYTLVCVNFRDWIISIYTLKCDMMCFAAALWAVRVPRLS